MSYSLPLSCGYTGARNRSQFITPQSGMCSFCTEECAGTCEIAMAAVLGIQTVYPTTTGNNQIAGEKDYPLDWSCFNINGRVFGAEGTSADYDHAEIFNVGLETCYGRKNKVKMALPIVLPALIKLNWKDYFGGAAMAGVSCMVGEDAKSKDPNLVRENGKITEFPFLGEIIESFNKYYRGYGQIFVQSNVEDDMQGVPEMTLKYGGKAIEFKFGQSAKGTQPVNRLKDIEQARARKAAGNLVKPDPDDPAVIKAWEEGVCPNFYQYGRLPHWTTEYLSKRIEGLRQMGAENFSFKMTGFDAEDIEKVLRMASECGVDLITFDGAGGGSGYSPCHMMNEWGLPAVMLEEKVVRIAEKLKAEGLELPAIVMTGGFATEDQVFKSLAMGSGDIAAVGLCRAAMAAAMTGKSVGDAVKAGKTPALFAKYGDTVEDVFADLADLRAIYGKEANDFSTGAVGVFSYLRKIGFGLQHFAALNRKFDIGLLNTRDLIPLTKEAAEAVNACR
ncbi:MAG: FMN-binding glutamate synthase family protein [Firmicutes bacterium]|nr:FMN-binding glutamate synthase family protein [Bacillota bacterium]